jgi:prepilin signal peptidase PulO-like enzyme (type II secretory pathway)
VTPTLCYVSFLALFAALAHARHPQLDARNRALYAFGAAGWIALQFAGWSGSAPTASRAALFAFVAVSATTDVLTGYVFDAVTFPAGTMLLVLSCLERRCGSAVGGSVLAALPLIVLYTVTRGRGLGFGDVKLAAAIGLGVGQGGALLCIGAAFVTGGAWGIVALARGADRERRVAFAPFLALGAAVTMCIGGSGRWLIG